MLSATKGPLARVECRCRARATSSLPVPVSPVTSTFRRVRETRPMARNTSRMAGALPINPASVGALVAAADGAGTGASSPATARRAVATA